MSKIATAVSMLAVSVVMFALVDAWLLGAVYGSDLVNYLRA